MTSQESLLILTTQWIWFGPAIVLFAQTAIFWIRHRDIDEDEYMTYDTESDLEVETVKAKYGSGATVTGEKASPSEKS